jgi:hypothetical protein
VQAEARAKVVELSYATGNGAAALAAPVTMAVALLPRGEAKEEENGELREGAGADGLKRAMWWDPLGRHPSTGTGVRLPRSGRHLRAIGMRARRAVEGGGCGASAELGWAGLLGWAEREAGGPSRRKIHFLFIFFPITAPNLPF